MTLPRGTFLGELTLFEVYAKHNGPRLFSAVDTTGKYYLAVSTEEEDDHERWLYAPISIARLTALRTGVVDLAEPFRRPEGGFAFHVTTFADAKRASTVEAIPFAKLSEDDLPRPGFKLKFTEPPAQWRLSAIRDAETSETSAHEARVVAKDDAGLTAPIFVSRLIRRWGQLAAALVPKVDMHVAAVSPGSLRTVFSAPKAKQRAVVERYSALVACGTDTTKLRNELSTPALVSAYFELVHLLAEEKSSLELATARRGATEVDVLELTHEIAQAQAAALAEPHVETKDLEIVATVTAASLSAQTIELRLKDNEVLSGFVTQGGGRLTGLCIGRQYHFAIKRITTGTPKGDPKIELEIHSAEADSGQFDVAAPRPQRGRAKHKESLEWTKLLSATDAQHAPSGSIRAYVPLGGSRTHDVNTRTWFRRELFGDLAWSRGDTPTEELTTGDFKVHFMGVVQGIFPFNLSHDVTRMRNNGEAPTRLHWNMDMRRLLRENDVTKHALTLRRDETGQLLVIIA